MRKSDNLDITLMVIFTVLCIISIFTPSIAESSLRTVLGLILILFMSGYSIISFLFPKKNDLDIIERITFSFGLSIAITVLIGLALNYTLFGIILVPALISISALTILFSFFAYIRRLRIPDKERFDVKFEKLFEIIKGSLNIKSKTDKILSVLLILSILFAVFTIVYTIATPKQDSKFTEFYLLGPNGKASDYPTNLTVGETGNVTVGIVNQEYADVNYKMVVTLDNITINEENITLTSGAKYEEPFTFALSKTGKNQELEFLLYKLPDDNDVYQSLHLWINQR